MAKEYTGPTIDEVKTSPALEPKVKVEEAPLPDMTNGGQPELPRFEEEKVPVSVAEMFNYKGDAVSGVFIKAFQDYADVLAGRKACMDPRKEQSNFMNTVYMTLDLDFDKFCVVTDYLVNAMVKDEDAFSDVNLFSLMPYVDKEFSNSQRTRYRSYILALVTLARAGRNRRNISQFIDIPTLISEFSDKAKNNVNSYFNRAYRF